MCVRTCLFVYTCACVPAHMCVYRWHTKYMGHTKLGAHKICVAYCNPLLLQTPIITIPLSPPLQCYPTPCYHLNPHPPSSQPTSSIPFLSPPLQPLSVELGPGILGNIYDGIQRPLKRIAELSGDVFIPRGVDVHALDRSAPWEFEPQLKVWVYRCLLMCVLRVCVLRACCEAMCSCFCSTCAERCASMKPLTNPRLLSSLSPHHTPPHPLTHPPPHHTHTQTGGCTCDGG